MQQIIIPSKYKSKQFNRFILLKTFSLSKYLIKSITSILLIVLILSVDASPYIKIAIGFLLFLEYVRSYYG